MSPHPPAQLAAEFAAAGIRDVECVFPDVSGHPRGKLMPTEAFANGAELFGERFVRACAAIREVEYASWLAEVGGWERRFLVAQA